MRVTLTVLLCALMLSGCVAQWPSHRAKMAALADDAVACQETPHGTNRLDTRSDKLCLTGKQWAERARHQAADRNDIPPLYPNALSAQVATGNPPQFLPPNR